MTRARDLADSADKDIAGTLTLDGLTVGTDNTGFGVSHSTASSTATNLTFYTTNGSATAILEFTHSGHGLSVGDLVNVGSSSVTSWLTTWGLFDLTSIADEVEVTETTSTTFRVNITCTSVQTSSASLGQGGSYVYYKGTTTLNSGMTTITGGNVGIGVDNTTNGNNPATRLDIRGSTETYLTIGNNTDNTSGLDTGIIFRPINNIGNPASIEVVGNLQPTTSSAYTAGFKFRTGDYNGSAFSNVETMTITASGKVGIGTTSPSSSLGAGGLHVTDRIAVGSGTAGTPALHYDGDTDTGVFFGTGVVAIGTGGSERMRINSIGNVGIGTTSPSEKLHVDGHVRIDNSYLKLNRSSTYNQQWEMGISHLGTSDYGTLFIYPTAGGQSTAGIKFAVGNQTTYPFSIDSNGSVNIDTTQSYSEYFRYRNNGTLKHREAYNSSVSDSIGSGGRVFIGDAAQDIIIGTGNSALTPTNSFIALNHSGNTILGAGNGTGRLFINGSTGFVGVNVGNPSTEFEVYSTDATHPAISLRPYDYINKGDYIGELRAYGTLASSYTGTGHAAIKFGSESSGGGARAGSTMEFWTNADGYAGTSPVKHMEISRVGLITTPNQCMFRAYQTTDPTTEKILTSGNSVTWVEQFDRNNDFSGGTFTAPVDGVYHFTCAWDDNGGHSGIELYKNGSTPVVRWEPDDPTGYGWQSRNWSSHIYLNANEYVQLYGRHVTNSVNPFHMGGGHWGWFSGVLVG